MSGRARDFTAVVGLAVLLAGCRIQIEHVRDGSPRTPQQIFLAVPGKLTLDAALEVFGAPDRVEALEDTDVLIFTSSERLGSHWQLENPFAYASGVGLSSIGTEAVGYVIFTKSLGPLTTAPLPFEPLSNTPGMTSKPLTLKGDARGHDEVRLVFTRKTLLLERVEVAHERPEGGILGVAHGTFLH